MGKPLEEEGGYSGEPQTVNLYQCGGSLIAPGVILTAAHCVDKFRQNPTELKIRCESGTLRTRQSRTLIRTDMFRHLIFTQSLMAATFRMTLLSSSHLKTLSSPAILTLSVFLKLMSCLMEQPVLPRGGARTSLDLQDSTRWSSRRLTSQW